MTAPIDVPMPQTTILKPIQATSHFFNVTAGPSRSNNTISLSVGTHYIIMDTQVPTGTINVRLRVSHGSQVIFPLGFADYSGYGSTAAKVVIDQAGSWVTVEGTTSPSGVDNTRVALTIVQMGTT